MSRRTWAWVRNVGGRGRPRACSSGGSAPGRSSTGVRTVDGRALLVATVIAMGTTVVLRLALERGGPRARAWALPMREARGVVLPLAVPQRDPARRRARRRAPRRAARPRGRGPAAGCPGRRLGPRVRPGGPGRAHRAGAAGAALAGPVVGAGGGALVVGGLVVVVLGCRALLRHGAARWSRMVRTAASDLRTGLLARRAWPVILVASSLAVVGHVAHLPGRGAHRRRRPPRRSSWCRWRCSCWSPWPSRPTWPAGVRARAWPRGRSRRPGSVPAQGVADRRASTACWCFVATLPGAVVLLAAGCARRTAHA